MLVLSVQEACAREVVPAGGECARSLHTWEAKRAGIGCAGRLCALVLGVQKGLCTWEAKHANMGRARKRCKRGLACWCQGGCARWCWVCKAACVHESSCTVVLGVQGGCARKSLCTLVSGRPYTLVAGVQGFCARGRSHTGAGCARELFTRGHAHWCQAGCAQWCWVCKEVVHTEACAHCSQGGLHPGGRCARGLCTWEVMLWCQGGCAHWCWACKAVCVHKSSRTAVLGMQGNLCASELMHTNTERARPSLCVCVCVCVCELGGGWGSHLPPSLPPDLLFPPPIGVQCTGGHARLLRAHGDGHHQQSGPAVVGAAHPHLFGGPKSTPPTPSRGSHGSSATSAPPSNRSRCCCGSLRPAGTQLFCCWDGGGVPYGPPCQGHEGTSATQP